MDVIVNIYLESTISSPKESTGVVGYVVEVPTSKGPATFSNFHSITATKNQAQIMALNMALSRIKKMPLALSIYADFDYLAAGFTQGWVDQWKENGWKNAKGEVVKNASLWQETLILLNGNEISVNTGEQHEYKNWIQNEMKRLEKKYV